MNFHRGSHLENIDDFDDKVIVDGDGDMSVNKQMDRKEDLFTEKRTTHGLEQNILSTAKL